MKIDPLKVPGDETVKGRKPRREDTEEQKNEERKKQWREPEGFVNGARVRRK